MVFIVRYVIMFYVVLLWLDGKDFLYKLYIIFVFKNINKLIMLIVCFFINNVVVFILL